MVALKKLQITHILQSVFQMYFQKFIGHTSHFLRYSSEVGIDDHYETFLLLPAVIFSVGQHVI